MSQCPVCKTEYTEGEVNRCSICNWDLTRCPEAFVERQNVQLAWAREMWVKFQALQKQLAAQINAEIDANPQLSQLRKESNLDAWNLLLTWVYAVDLDAAKAAVERLQEKHQGKQPCDIAHILIVQKSFQTAGVDLVRGISDAAAILSGLARVDLPTITRLSVEMIYQIAAIYGLDLQVPERKLEVLTAFSVALLAEQAIKAGIDWLKCGISPGKVISAGAKGLMIYAVGKAACLFYEAKVNQHVSPLNSPELFDELREESQDYLEDATCEDAIVNIISFEIETTPIKIPVPKPVKKPSLPARTPGGAASLRGHFVLPYLIEQGMQQRLGHDDITNVIPLNKELVVVFTTNGAALLNLNSGEVLWDIDCPAKCGVISPNGNLVALGWHEDIYLWDLRDGQLLWQLQGHSDDVTSVAISPDGNLLASGSDDRTVRLWDIASRKQVRQLEGHTEPLWGVAFTPNGKLVASGSYDDTVRLWNVACGRELRRLQDWFGVGSIAFSPDGKLLASGSSDHDTVRLWNVASGKEVRQLQGHTGAGVSSVAFTPDGKLLASAGVDKTVRLWDVATGLEVEQLIEHTFRIAFTPDGKLLASFSDETVRLWDVASGLEVRQLQVYTRYVHSVAFTPNGRLLAFGRGRTVQLWDVVSGKQVQQLEICMYLSVLSVAISPDGKLLALGCEDETVRLWDVASGRELRQLQGHKSWVNTVAFTSDGKLLASGSGYGKLGFGRDDTTMRLWDIASGQELRQLKGHTDKVNSAAFTPDGKLLASGSSDNTVRLWDVASGRELRQLQEHTGSVYGVAFTPDGKLLASGSDDKTVRLWDIASGREVRRLQTPTSSVSSVAISCDGKLLASGSWDDTIRLWDVVSGRELRQLQGHTGWVDSLAIAPNGELLASASSDKTVRLWKVKI